MSSATHWSWKDLQLKTGWNWNQNPVGSVRRASDLIRFGKFMENFQLVSKSQEKGRSLKVCGDDSQLSNKQKMFKLF